MLHAHFAFEKLVLLGSEIPPQHRVEPNPMVNLSLHLDRISRAEQVFASFSEGGTVFMPFGQTFWSPDSGMPRDRYGFSWMVSAEQA